VLGSPIAHSLSPALHRAAYAALGLSDWRYDSFEVDEQGMAGFLSRLGPQWAGLSLTMPLKRVVIGLLDEISPLAEQVGAVNTLVLAEDGRRVGSNTDVAGVIGALADAGIHPEPPGRDAHAGAVILGGGATAASAVAGLAALGWRTVTMCARSPLRAAEVIEVGQRFDVEVRFAQLDGAAELVGRAEVTVATVPGGALADLAERAHVATRRNGHPAVLLDAIYDPWPTPLAAAWPRAGGVVVCGREMLIHQAVDQVTAMTGLTPDVQVLRDAVPH
jgi:shikimate dehydrogenase